MERMKECTTFWVVRYMQGNDWDMLAYREEEVCHTEEELQRCLDCLDCYTYDIEVERVTYYEFENKVGI